MNKKSSGFDNPSDKNPSDNPSSNPFNNPFDTDFDALKMIDNIAPQINKSLTELSRILKKAGEAIEKNIADETAINPDESVSTANPASEKGSSPASDEFQTVSATGSKNDPENRSATESEVYKIPADLTFIKEQIQREIDDTRKNGSISECKQKIIKLDIQIEEAARLRDLIESELNALIKERKKTISKLEELQTSK